MKGASRTFLQCACRGRADASAERTSERPRPERHERERTQKKWRERPHLALQSRSAIDCNQVQRSRSSGPLSWGVRRQRASPLVSIGEGKRGLRAAHAIPPPASGRGADGGGRRRLDALMEFAAPHQTPGDVRRLQRCAFGW